MIDALHEDGVGTTADESDAPDAETLLMAHLRAVHDQRLGDADRAWSAYQERIGAAATDSTEAE